MKVNGLKFILRTSFLNLKIPVLQSIENKQPTQVRFTHLSMLRFLWDTSDFRVIISQATITFNLVFLFRHIQHIPSYWQDHGKSVSCRHRAYNASAMNTKTLLPPQN